MKNGIEKLNLIQKSTIVVGRKLFEQELRSWRLNKKDPKSIALKQRPDVIQVVLEGYSDLMQNFFESEHRAGSPGQAREAEMLVRKIQSKIDKLDGIDDDYMSGFYCGSIIRRAIDHTKRLTGKKYSVF